VPDVHVWPLLSQISLDGMHPLRRRVLEQAMDNEKPMSTASFAGRLDLPQTSVRRHLEDLAALGVLTKAHFNPEEWVASERTRAQRRAAAGP
jgi:predicted ArsR family transcriptional regulator